MPLGSLVICFLRKFTLYLNVVLLPLLQSITNIDCQFDADVCLSLHLESLSSRLWTNNDIAFENGSMGLSLLHLTAGLGYNKCIKVLISWRNQNSSWVLEYQVDALSQDLNSCTPLVGGCLQLWSLEMWDHKVRSQFIFYFLISQKE